MGSVDSQAIHTLLATAGVGPIRTVAPMAGGANNRVFRVETRVGVFLLKSYFRHPNDPRDRLAAEFAFARFAWDAGARCIPQPLACDPEAGLGLFEFVYGRSLQGGAAGEAAVDQALDFYRTLTRAKGQPAADTIPLASESCFCLDDHFATVDRRVEKLQSFPVVAAVDQDAARFVETQLVPTWQRVHTSARETAATKGLSTDRPLDVTDRCISPSDFGFHNAILANDGRLRFIDFEYAGWDDPAKLICDFFCQPAVPAPLQAFDRFAAMVAAEFAEPQVHLARATMLLPVYRAKWVCIMLNEFLPLGGSRRAFSGTAVEQETRKATQLAKALTALAAIPLTGVTTRKVA